MASVIKSHSALGPSSAERWWNCPGSINASEGIPRSPSSFAAAEGTVAHTLAEEFVTKKLTLAQLQARVGDTLMQEDHEIEITEEMVDAAILYRDVIVKDTEALAHTAGGSDVIGSAEVAVAAHSLDARLRGTADYILFKKGKALRVYDFKYGKGVIVAVEGNKQALIYAIASMETEAGHAFDEVEVIIVQPRAGGSAVKRWVVPLAYLAQFKVDLKAAAKRTLAPDAPLVAGKWCRWCPAEAGCPAKYAQAMTAAQVDFADTPPAVAKVVKGEAKTLPVVSQMPIGKMVEALEWQDFLDSWFEAIRLHVKGLLEEGHEVPGYKLVDGKSNRRWISEDGTIEAFDGVLGVEQLFEKKLLSPAKLEKIVGKGKLEEMGLTMKPEAPKTVARSDDPRPMSRSSAAEDFAPLIGSDPLMDELLGAPTVKTREPIWP